jgi:hypothetical protein
LNEKNIQAWEMDIKWGVYAHEFNPITP